MAREYKAYLIRLQRNSSREPWRATLQNAHTGEQMRFANEQAMLRHLIDLMATDPQDSEQDDEGM
ncbi:MAG: hypothetical protein R3293_18150 [Candidatus Promineifilaceae bacterium]|nr:hypothetical protein [Candidatus Promineifilaceae bacterium]